MCKDGFYSDALQRLINAYNNIANNCITVYADHGSIIMAEYGSPQLKFTTWQSAYEFFETFAILDIADSTN